MPAYLLKITQLPVTIEQCGTLLEKGIQRVDIVDYNIKKDSESVSKSLIINGSGDRI